MPESVTIRGDAILLDILLVRRFGFAGQTLLEYTLELNPGLAEKGSVIPIGETVLLPDNLSDNPFEPPLTPSLFG